MQITLVWQGANGRYGVLKDGVYAAMKIIGRDHDVRVVEPMDEIAPDEVVLYWEAPVTTQGKDAANYNRVRNLSNRKALLFAGGPIRKPWLDGFDHVFVEGEFNKREMDELGIPCSIAFGVNDEIFKPKKEQKVFDGIMHATFAGWKRQPLFSEALGEKGLLCGRYQEGDPSPWTDSCKSVRLPDMPTEALCALINASHAVVNTSEYWGGGQRCTLEGMACGVPVIVMSDSPKNREFVEESGAGLIVDPTPDAIRTAVEVVKGWTPEEKSRGIDYIRSKWTAQHYAEALLKWIL